MEKLKPRDGALLRRVGANDAGSRALAVKLGRPRLVATGRDGGFREGRSRCGEIDRHSARKGPEITARPGGPRSRSTSALMGKATPLGFCRPTLPKSWAAPIWRRFTFAAP